MIMLQGFDFLFRWPSTAAAAGPAAATSRAGDDDITRCIIMFIRTYRQPDDDLHSNLHWTSGFP